MVTSAPDYTEQAQALFSAFVTRHRLRHRVVAAPVELLWEVPAQERLKLPITLGLQNGDELNFGVPSFWSYFFPFPNVRDEFDRLLDAWIEGRARVSYRGRFRARILELFRDGEWRIVYRAHDWARWPHANKVVSNIAP